LKSTVICRPKSDPRLTQIARRRSSRAGDEGQRRDGGRPEPGSAAFRCIHSNISMVFLNNLPDVFVHVHDVETAGMKTLVAGQVLAYNTTARDGRLTLTLQTFASVRASFASIGQQELNPCDRNSLPFLGGVSHN
jgi:hypothetical protein